MRRAVKLYRFRFVLSHYEHGYWNEFEGMLWARDATEAKHHVQCLSHFYVPSAVVKLVEWFPSYNLGKDFKERDDKQKEIEKDDRADIRDRDA